MMKSDSLSSPGSSEEIPCFPFTTHAENGPHSNSSFATSEMQSVANKIQDRYHERSTEQHACEQALTENREVKRSLLYVREAHQNTRVAFLEAVQDTQELELGFHRFQQGERSTRDEAAKLTMQNSLLQREHGRVEESWGKENDIMTLAVAKREEYLHLIDGAVKRVDEIQRMRQRKLLRLKDLSARFLDRSKTMAHVTQQLQREVQTSEEDDIRCQTEIQRSSDQVRSQLAKRATLRDALREAQSSLRKVTDDPNLHEQEIMDGCNF